MTSPTDADDPEQIQEMRTLARSLAENEIAPRAVDIDGSEEFPHDILELFRKNGFLSLVVPGDLGGVGAGLLHVAAVAEELATVDVSSAVTFNGHSSCVSLVDRVGSEEQRRRLLSRVVAGSMIAIALSEPEAGSDAASIRTRAVRHGDTYVLNGLKHYCTNADVSDIILVFAVTAPGEGSHGISIFAVDRSNPGLSVTRSEAKMGLHGTTTVEFTLNDCEVPAADRIGAENEGYRAGMRALQRGRVGIASVAVGITTGVLAHAAGHAKARKQFGHPIGSFQGLQFKLADIAIELEASRQLVAYAARLGAVQAPTFPTVAAKAKCFATDVAMRATIEAVQTFGGAGYIRGSFVERAMRDAKILQIFEGTNELMRMLVARDLLGRL